MEQKSKFDFSKLDKKTMLKIGIGVGVVIGGALLIWFLVGGKGDGLQSLKDKATNVTGGENGISEKQSLVNPADVSYLSGLPCENHNRRAVAVMLASDTSTRPLSGLSEADMVFEMPVITTFLARLGVLKPKWLADRRRTAIIVAFILAAIITPTFDPINQSLVAVPLIVLYEMSIWLAKLVYKKEPIEVSPVSSAAS